MPNEAVSHIHKANKYLDQARSSLTSDQPEAAQTFATMGLMELHKSARAMDESRTPRAKKLIDMTLQLHQIYTEARIRQGIEFTRTSV